METGYSSKTLNHLGLVAGMCDRLGLVEEIDKILPAADDQQLISNGTCVKALILNGLGFVERRLYLVSQFFEDKPVSHLLGEGVQSEQLNDDRLARCLDSLYAFGVSELFSLLSFKACQVLGLGQEQSPSFLHLDSSSFHLDGVYNSEAPQEDLGDCIQVCQGYSRDHRPDLNQVMLNLVVEHSAGIPLMMEALSGNTSDAKSFRSTIQDYISRLTPEAPRVCWVADSALYNQESLSKISTQSDWISRVPERISEAKVLLDEIKVAEMKAFAEESLSSYRYQKVASQYAGIEQSWLVIFSEQAYERQIKSLHKQYSQQGLQECKALESLSRQVFTCQEDAQKALDKFEKSLKMSYLAQKELLPMAGYSKVGRPAKGQAPQVLGYQIKACLASKLDAYEKLRERQGKFILASHQSQELCTDGQLLMAYKNQSKVEKGFRFLKDKQFMASTLFVKKPQRLEAILMIMSLCLLVYAALEKELRQELQQKNETVPNQLKKQIQNPTMRWIFALLAGIHCLYIHDQMIILNLNDTQRKIIKLLGNTSKKYYQLE